MIEPQGDESWCRAANRVAKQSALIYGSIPFTESVSPALYSTSSVLNFHSEDMPPGSSRMRRGAAKIISEEQIPSEADYEKMVEEARQVLVKGAINKVVLARKILYKIDKYLDISKICERLLSQNHSGFSFCLDLGESHFLGASPELLVKKRGGEVFASPMAGSRPRGATPEEDSNLVNELLTSDKDRKEHAIVVDFIVQALEKYCVSISVSDVPEVRSTPHLLHLTTDIRGTLREASTTSIDLAYALHPTPAVCGHPKELAMNLIKQLEPFDRENFAGAVGWCDEFGDGEWAVAIRSAIIRGGEVCLFAGAGIVAESVPHLELKETSVKFRTMQQILQLEGAV